MRRASIEVGYFEALYDSGDGDPWHFATSSYEKRKYAATLDALPKQRFSRALEIGCSIGVLTRMLAERGDALVATEPVAKALDAARCRCADFSNIRFEQEEAPAQWPQGSFDLILLSEVVYYLAPDGVRALATRIASSLSPGGHVLLVHWVKETDYPLSGDDAVACFLSVSPGLRIIRQERTGDYRLDLAEAIVAETREGAAP